MSTHLIATLLSTEATELYAPMAEELATAATEEPAAA